MSVAIAKREMQFCAGPEHHTFYACHEHRADLERGDVMCFLILRTKPVEAVDPEDDIDCDLCREGGQP